MQFIKDDQEDEESGENPEPPPLPQPRVQRECLQCGKRFVATGRLNRICRACKKFQHSSCEEFTSLTYKFKKEAQIYGIS